MVVFAGAALVLLILYYLTVLRPLRRQNGDEASRRRQESAEAALAPATAERAAGAKTASDGVESGPALTGEESEAGTDERDGRTADPEELSLDQLVDSLTQIPAERWHRTDQYWFPQHSDYRHYAYTIYTVTTDCGSALTLESPFAGSRGYNLRIGWEMLVEDDRAIGRCRSQERSCFRLLDQLYTHLEEHWWPIVQRQREEESAARRARRIRRQ